MPEEDRHHPSKDGFCEKWRKRAYSLPAVNRFVIIGASGSGKTWLGNELAARTGYLHLELDAIFWQKDWTPRPKDEMATAVSAIIEADQWIIDGNYGSLVQPMVLAAADTVVWLDLPRWRVMTAITRRTIDRGLRRRELWNGNRESLRNILRWEPEDNIIRWAWVKHPEYRRQYAAMAADPHYAHLEWVRLRSRRQVDYWLDRVAPKD